MKEEKSLKDLEYDFVVKNIKNNFRDTLDGLILMSGVNSLDYYDINISNIASVSLLAGSLVYGGYRIVSRVKNIAKEKRATDKEVGKELSFKCGCLNMSRYLCSLRDGIFLGTSGSLLFNGFLMGGNLEFSMGCINGLCSIYFSHRSHTHTRVIEKSEHKLLIERYSNRER